MAKGNLEVRLGRARSWMALAKGEHTSEHARFIFYWITFNCLYGLPPIDPENLDKEPESQMSEIRQFLTRLKELSRLDRVRGTQILQKAVIECIPHAKTLVENPFLSREYWEGAVSPVNIRTSCCEDWKHAKSAMDRHKDYDSLLFFTFYRLTVLRNQIIHGSATASAESMGYKESLQPGLRFLESVVPAVFQLLENYGDRITDWPKAPYPRRGHQDHPHS